MAAKRKSVLPGFGLSLGYTMVYLSVLVLLPLGVLVVKAARLSPGLVWETLTDSQVVAAFKLTLWTSAAAGAISAVFGLIIAWTLVRYRFPGRRFFDALIDLPFALPTAVAGLTFSSLYMPNGWIGGLGHNVVWGINGVLSAVGAGRPIAEGALDWLSFPLSYTSGGIVIVLTFVGFPFVVRTIQPVLQEWQTENEQAAASLGAGRWTTFRRIIWPEIQPAFWTGLALAFSRAVGEYGSVIFISRGKPGESQIVPQQIVTKLWSFDANGLEKAHIVAAALLLLSLAILLTINGLQWWGRRERS